MRSTVFSANQPVPTGKPLSAPSRGLGHRRPARSTRSCASRRAGFADRRAAGADAAQFDSEALWQQVAGRIRPGDACADRARRRCAEGSKRPAAPGATGWRASGSGRRRGGFCRRLTSAAPAVRRDAAAAGAGRGRATVRSGCSAARGGAQPAGLPAAAGLVARAAVATHPRIAAGGARGRLCCGARVTPGPGRRRGLDRIDAMSTPEPLEPQAAGSAEPAALGAVSAHRAAPGAHAGCTGVAPAGAGPGRRGRAGPGAQRRCCGKSWPPSRSSWRARAPTPAPGRRGAHAGAPGPGAGARTGGAAGGAGSPPERGGLQRSQLEELMQSLSRSRDENLVVDIESACGWRSSRRS